MNLQFDATPPNLLSSTNDLMNQPKLLPRFLDYLPEEDVGFASLLNGGKKGKKVSPKKPVKKESKPVKKESKPTKKESKPVKKVKLIDTFLKTDLEKIAKKHDVNLKARDGKIKTKEQLFDSLKRKKLV